MDGLCCVLRVVSLGLDENEPNKANFDVYRQHFETPFIQATADYYATESRSFLAENSVSAYMKRAEDRLREEEDRIERYLSSTTRKIVRGLVVAQVMQILRVTSFVN
jgi:cullin 1